MTTPLPSAHEPLPADFLRKYGAVKGMLCKHRDSSDWNTCSEEADIPLMISLGYDFCAPVGTIAAIPAQSGHGKDMIEVIDPGHKYIIKNLDGPGHQVKVYVKRDDPPEKFPGNIGHYEGITLQMDYRTCLDRLLYLQKQDPHANNLIQIDRLKEMLWLQEERAAIRHGYVFNITHEEAATLPMCPHCGHVICEKLGNARKAKKS